MTSGVNVSVNVTYNSIPCCSAGPLTNSTGECDCLITDPNLFDPDGVVNISVTTWNRISGPLTESVDVEVLKKVKDANFTILTTYSQFGSGVEGAGPERNIFPAEYPVEFNGSYSGGPATLQWSFSCSEETIPAETEQAFQKTFSSAVSQECAFEMKLTNSISNTTVVREFKLYESVKLKDLSNNGPGKMNQTIRFTIEFEKLGTQTCLWVDMGDNSPLRVFGSSNSCPDSLDVDSINPHIAVEPRTLFTSLYAVYTQSIVIDHIYSQVGDYDVRLYASNAVSSVSRETVAAVLPFVCKYPNVTIKGLSPNSSNALNAPQVYRSDILSLFTENEVFCEITEQTKTSWTLLKLEDDPRTTPSDVLVADMRKTLFHTVNDTSALQLARRFLPYGYYEIRARVEMRGVPGVFGIDSTIIQVVQTPWIQAAVNDGSFHTVIFGFLGTLDSSASVDPDFDSTDGMNFVWYCKDIDDDAEFNQATLTQEPVVSDRDVVGSQDASANASGCFGSGRGRIDTSNSTLILDTNVMIEGKAYEILLVVSTTHPEFGQRKAMTTIYLQVALGFPPVLATICSRNCESKLRPDEKTILLSKCSRFCAGELTFSWSLYLYDNINQHEPFNLSSLTEVPEADFQNMAMNPVDELEIGIKPDSLQVGKKYTIAFRATRVSGVYGECRTTVIVNTPPAGGRCSVSPLSGVALSTNFTFRCENWTDTDSPLVYEVSYVRSESKTMLFHRSHPPGANISVTDWLVVGDKNKNYSLTVEFTVKDTVGSKTVQHVDIQVLPNNVVDTNQISGRLDEYIASGDSEGFLRMASTFASTFNDDPDSGDENSTGLSPEKQEQEKKLLEHVLTSLSGMKPKDVSGVMQFSGSLAQLAANPDKLTSKAKDATFSMADTLTDSLKDLSDNDKGFRYVKSGASNVLNVLGGMVSSASGGSGNISTTIKNETASAVNRTVKVVRNLQSVVLDNLVTNEGPDTIDTDTLSLQVEKKTGTTLGNTGNELKGSRFKPPSGYAFGIGEILSNPNKTFLQKQPVDIKIVSFKQNPFSWDNTSSTVLSNVIDIVVESNLNISSSNMSEDVSVTILRDLSLFPEDSSFFMKPRAMNLTENWKEYLKFHCFTRKSNYTAMNFEIKPHHLGVHLNVYLKRGGRPSVEKGDYEFSYKLPDFSSCNVGNTSVNKSKSDDSDPVHIDINDCSTHPYTVFVSNLDFNGTGEYCFGKIFDKYLVPISMGIRIR
ncbi:sperm receptor for egg jelly-like [Dendronephthya gigantea]|uniref:sperm receptor for egg jelly-like n=1 Tax=Dendronephthya gigantea TaxID=151771 RepID=UPI00106D0124|nr:sperm receptor for egg jelly-like [Dendronephthya gigantea]